MNWSGKLVGGALGYALSETLLGVAIGAFIGHILFDRSIRPKRSARSGNNSGTNFDRRSRERRQEVFFITTFSVMGHISKSDGRVSAEEIQLAQQVMQQMRLDKDQRTAAIEYFNRGKQANFMLDETLEEFRNECGSKTALMQMFIEIQLQAVYADGTKMPNEAKILRHICLVLGYPEALLAQMESMLFASQRSHQSYGSNGVGASTALKDAYEIIGVDSSSTDVEVKKAYRRLMSQNHPDKLISKGLPEEMIAIATNKTQEIQKAYDLISENR